MGLEIKRRVLSVQDEKKAEDLQAKVEDQRATIEYLSMMSGIDLPEDSQEEQTAAEMAPEEAAAAGKKSGQ